MFYFSDPLDPIQDLEQGPLHQKVFPAEITLLIGLTVLLIATQLPYKKGDLDTLGDLYADPSVFLIPLVNLEFYSCHTFSKPVAIAAALIWPLKNLVAFLNFSEILDA